jgi:hypothetical protein
MVVKSTEVGSEIITECLVFTAIQFYVSYDDCGLSVCLCSRLPILCISILNVMNTCIIALTCWYTIFKFIVKKATGVFFTGHKFTDF